ncbi:MAG: hypothetical protein DWQ19_09200 [Crenarchaeota archaeon]|nr:MAG: hypothetical protein DWQ19_09200 [Thermoproteota archaeon]
MKEFKKILPDYPRTEHFPWKPNTSRDDLVASREEAAVVFISNDVEITEKVDGAQCAMALYEGHPVIRNSNHILAKGYVKDTPAKKQFASIFNWFYENKHKFEKLNELIDNVGVYGEWMVAQHGLEYDCLPDKFIAFDLYNYQTKEFVCSKIARQLMEESGFVTVPLLYYGRIYSYDQLEAWANESSPFTTRGKREGIYIKVNDKRWVKQRFKMVRQGFVQGSLWDHKKLKKNKFTSC